MIVVTAPTGQIGSQLVQHLLAAHEAVRVIVRDPAKLSADIREKVEVVQGSHGDAAVVQQAFQGADAVFWLLPADPRAKSVEAAYVDFLPACLRGVPQQGREACGGRFKPGPRQTAGGPCRSDYGVVGDGRPNCQHRRQVPRACAVGFMDNMLRQVATIKSQGVFSSPIPGDLKAATCATLDIAAAAAKLLMDRSWSGTGEVPVLGPEDLSFNEMAQIMSQVLGKPVRFEEMPDGAMKSMLLAYGQSDAMAQATVDLLAAIKEGIYSNEPRTPETDTPTSFRQWCEDVLKPAVLQ